MQAVLRPMNLGEILDRTFEIYRKQFLRFAGIAALPAAVMLGIRSIDIIWVHTERLLGFDGVTARGRFIFGWVLSWGYSHISGFVWGVMEPAFVRTASGDLFGESHSIMGSLRFIAARWRRYLWVAFLVVLSGLIFPEVLAFGVFFATGTVEDKLGLLGDSPSAAAIVVLLLPILAGVVLIFWVKVSFSFSIPAATLEELPGLKSLRRSWRLTKGSRGRIFVAWIMAFACALVLDGVVAFLAWWIATLVYTGHYAHGFNRQAYEVVINFFYAVVAAVVGPLYPIAVTLLYYDERSRKEGYDVEKLMEAAGLMAPVPAGGENPAPEIKEKPLSLVPGPASGLPG